MATYDRGRHILPSVRSVLQQTFRDFELLIVGDGCADDTEEVLAPYLGPRVRWVCLPFCHGSQSGPNNEGIRASRGTNIAYIGHDDVWSPGHLEALAPLLAEGSGTDFAVSGAIFHMPPGVEAAQVTGLFEETGAAASNFFPPSSFAHRKEVVRAIGDWRAPQSIRPPVDCDFLLRAVEAGMVFRSTGRVTVHKFAAGHRYLSYLEQESWEQERMLAELAADGGETLVEEAVALAKRSNGYMAVIYPDFGRLEPGRMARENAVRKGLRIQCDHLPAQREVLVETDDAMALDWQARDMYGLRHVFRNPNPKILIPYAAGARVGIHVLFAHHDPEALSTLVVRTSEARLLLHFGKPRKHGRLYFAPVSIPLGLKTDRATFMQLELHPRQRPDGGNPGLAYAIIMVDPDGALPDTDEMPAEMEAWLTRYNDSHEPTEPEGGDALAVRQVGESPPGVCRPHPRSREGVLARIRQWLFFRRH